MTWLFLGGVSNSSSTQVCTKEVVSFNEISNEILVISEHCLDFWSLVLGSGNRFETDSIIHRIEGFHTEKSCSLLLKTASTSDSL